MTAVTHEAGVLDEVRTAVRDTATDAVFGTPISQDGLMVLPMARVRGGGGGGNGTAAQGGSGGGFGVNARPVGAFVIQHGMVRWKPAIDVTRIVLGGQIVAIVALLTARAAMRAYRRRS